METARKQGIAGLAEGTIRRWFTEPFIRRAKDDVEKVRNMILGTGVEGYVACAGAVRDMAQTTILLKIDKPTLVMTGRQDPRVHGRPIDRPSPGDRRLTVDDPEDAAHLSNIEQPAAFNRALRTFLDGVDDGLPALS